MDLLWYVCFKFQMHTTFMILLKILYFATFRQKNCQKIPNTVILAT